MYDVAEQAGFKIDHVFNEPTFAVIGNGLSKLSGIHYYLIVHFGGSTFNVEFMSVED